MKKIYAVSILALMMVLFIHNGYSQNACQTPELSINLAGLDAFNQYVTRFKARGKDLNTDLKTIPTIIHVIYRNSADKQEISKARIKGQIDATNKQLRRLNANAKNTRPLFVPVAADCNLKIELANKNNGVIYHHYPNFVFNSDNFRAIQAATIVKPDKYLNVWVIPGVGGGAATWPWDKTATRDGFWVGEKYFGITGSNLSEFMNGGTTFTHELGHYLGLFHSHHDGEFFRGDCDRIHDGSIADYCADTPIDWSDPVSPEQCFDGIDFSCEPELICQSENYMYYNRDSCTNMFSKDQRARMRACLRSLRSKLVKSSNNDFAGVNSENFKDLFSDKPALEKKIIIFPNPTNSIVHITYHDLAVKGMSIKIYNQVGLKLKELHSITAINELSLDAFAEGVYYLTITIDKASVTKYVIKAGSKPSF